MNCADCKDTGAIGDLRFLGGDYCHCKIGKELRASFELAFKLENGSYPEELEVCCDGCGNIDTEAECHDSCPHQGCSFEHGCQHGAATLSADDIEMSRCLRCGRHFEGPYGSSPCPDCRAKCKAEFRHSGVVEDICPDKYLPLLPHNDPEEDVPF